MGSQPNETLNNSVLPKRTKSEHKDILMEPPSYKEQEESARLAGELERALSELGIEAEIENWDEGPTCTTYHAVLAPDANLHDIAELNWDIMDLLECKSVIFHASAFDIDRADIEISRSERRIVNFGDLLPYLDGDLLDVAIGVDSYGAPVHAVLTELPHILVAGTTGSGRTTFLNTIIAFLLMRNAPEDVRLILVDPKQVEFVGYNGIPHLVMPVITDMRKAVTSLYWVVTEMGRRRRLFSTLGVRDLGDYNALVDSGLFDNGDSPLQHLPSVVIVIDELADLMVVVKKDVEASIVRIAQLGRAAGIHLIIATQCPQAHIVTDPIRANITAHAAQRICKSSESCYLLNETGAENLLPQGDMLFLNPNWGDRPQRIQGCLISKPEISRIIERLKTQPPSGPWQGMTPIPAMDAEGIRETICSNEIQLAIRAARLVVKNQLGSTRMVQRRLKLTDLHSACHIMDMLEEIGVVRPAAYYGSLHRDVLVQSPEDLEAILAGAFGDETQLEVSFNEYDPLAGKGGKNRVFLDGNL